MSRLTDPFKGVPPSSPHFYNGSLPIAFVFSVPGRVEQRRGRPVAGDTGENLDSALAYLHAACPVIFSSCKRYDYRITNVFAEPIAVSLGHTASEAKSSEILCPRNIARVIHELDGCRLVILCGNKPKLLLKTLGDSGKTVIDVPHIGNKGLNSSFSLQLLPAAAKSSERRQQRVELWAKAVLARAKG